MVLLVCAHEWGPPTHLFGLVQYVDTRRYFEPFRRNCLDFFHCRHFSKDSHILIKSRLFHSWTKSPNFVTYLSVMETTMSFPPTYHYQMSVCKCMRKRFSCFLKSKSICPLLLFRRGLLISSCFRCDLIRILNVSSFAEAGRVVRVC